LALWKKKAGSYRKLRQLIDELGIKGHLAKGHQYVAGAILGEEEKALKKPIIHTSDGDMNDAGWRWSEGKGRWVRPEEWAPLTSR
jgi:hypothetical protein